MYIFSDNFHKHNSLYVTYRIINTTLSFNIVQPVKVAINQQKVTEDEKLDGLKGYITNTTLVANDVYEHYNGLWVIENAF